jgi:hypothetical protein
VPPLSEMVHILCNSGYLPCANFLLALGLSRQAATRKRKLLVTARPSRPPLCALRNAPKWGRVWQEGHSGPTSLVVDWRVALRRRGLLGRGGAVGILGAAVSE